MTTRNAAGAYPTCLFLCSTRHHAVFALYVFSTEDECVPLRRYISVPRGLSGFFEYAWVGMVDVAQHILPLFCPILSLVLYTCVLLLCPNVSRCLLSIVVHSCRRHSAPSFYRYTCVLAGMMHISKDRDEITRDQIEGFNIKY